MRNDETNKRGFIFVTKRCDNNCKYCFMKNDLQFEDMTLDTYKNALKYLGGNNYRNITFIGGEPLLFKQLYTYIELALKQGFNCSISTSGFKKLDEQLERIFSLKLTNVTISLDSSDEEINNDLRGEDAFNRAVYTANYFKKINLPFKVTATITSANHKTIFDLIKMIRGMGAFQLDLHVMSFIGNAKNNKSLGILASDWHKIRKQIDEMKFDSPFHIFYPVMFYEDSEQFAKANNYCGAKEKKRLNIMPNGDCYYCTLAMCDQSPVGNINQPNSMGAQKKKCDNFTEHNLHYLCRFYKLTSEFK